MITEDERFIKIQGILSFSDIHPADCIKINDLIIELSKENQQLKEDLEKSIKVQIKTNKILIGIEEWINDYINALEKQGETIEGLDVFEEHTLIVLDDVKTILNELKDSDIT